MPRFPLPPAVTGIDMPWMAEKLEQFIKADIEGSNYDDAQDAIHSFLWIAENDEDDSPVLLFYLKQMIKDDVSFLDEFEEYLEAKINELRLI